MLGLTLVTFAIGAAGLGGLTLSLSVLGLALVKGQLVGDWFMGLRGDPGPLALGDRPVAAGARGPHRGRLHPGQSLSLRVGLDGRSSRPIRVLPGPEARPTRNHWSSDARHPPDRSPADLLPPPGRGGGAVRARLPQPPADDDQGPHRVRQDALRALHGRAPGPAALHRRLPRRPHRRGPGGAPPDRRRRDLLERRPPDPGRARGGHLLSGRGGGGAQGHHRGPAPADRRPPHPAPGAHRARPCTPRTASCWWSPTTPATRTCSRG